MHIIVVSSSLANTRSLTLTGTHLLAGAFGAAAAVIGLAAGLLFLAVPRAAQLKLPVLESALASVQEQQTRKSESFLRENIDAMAIKIGQMQAQLVRLSALGERVSALAGLRPGEFRFGETPGRGGAVSTSVHSQNMSMMDISRQVDALSHLMDSRGDDLGILESALFDARSRKRLLPTVIPVHSSWKASSFGWRIDPFTGENAMHEGIDFAADVGTPIFAAAAGVVVYAQYHPQYGNLVEIDHGNDVVTRYAHASRILVKPGQLVQRGSKIAEVGSTGRSTGPHLHFEVRYRGVAQNPAKFLRASR